LRNGWGERLRLLKIAIWRVVHKLGKVSRKLGHVSLSIGEESGNFCEQPSAPF